MDDLRQHVIYKLPSLFEISIESTLATLHTHLPDYSHDELIDSLSQKALLQMQVLQALDKRTLSKPHLLLYFERLCEHYPEEQVADSNDDTLYEVYTPKQTMLIDVIQIFTT